MCVHRDENKQTMVEMLGCRHILIRMSGGKADATNDKCHARFAAACAVNDLLCEVPAWQVAETWGKPDTLSKAGRCSRILLSRFMCLPSTQQSFHCLFHNMLE